MIKTRMTELLGIKYPIMQGGMQHFGVPEMAAAVSNAGGLGCINASIYPEYEDLRAAIRRTKELCGDKPFALNVSIFPELIPLERIAKYLEIAGEEGVAAIESSGQSPEMFVPLIHSYGMKHIHKVPAAKHAVTAQRIGVDMVTIAGLEVAGHPGMQEVGTIVLARKAATLVDIPVLVAGGIGDGHGIAAALALGGEGVVLGTRFLATQECTLNMPFKEWILNANEKDTLLAQKSIHNMIRVADNATARKCLEMEAQGATLQELMTVIAGVKSRAAFEAGDTEGAMFAVGPVIGLINDIPTCQELMDRMMAECEETIRGLGAKIQ